MVRYGWPRPPFILGFILGRLAEICLRIGFALRWLLALPPGSHHHLFALHRGRGVSAVRGKAIPAARGNPCGYRVEP